MRRYMSAIILALLLLPGVAHAQQKTLELWTFIDPAGDAPRSKALAEIIRTFEAQNAGVKVKPTIFAWNQIGLQFLKAAQAGRTPDVPMLNAGRIQRDVAAGILRPLDDGLDKTGQRADYILLPNALAGGKTYGVPYEVRALGFLYRTDLLEKAGLPVPTSLADLTAAAKKMQDIAGPNFIGGGIGFDPSADSAEKFYVPAVAALGGKILKDDGSAEFVSPQAIKAMNYIHDLVHKDKVMPSTSV